MKKLIMFDEEEYHKIRELLAEIKCDIWDLVDSADRSVMFNDLEKLEELLGIYD